MGSVAGVQNADYSRPCGLALLLLGVEALGSAALNHSCRKIPIPPANALARGHAQQPA
jgi:hypothetical protein